ncbi:MAG: PAS domain-containing protein [Candidatus Accumulibacter sp.]|nr:PAS domain-containing protein [Accumulibacter sp.]
MTSDRSTQSIFERGRCCMSGVEENADDLMIVRAMAKGGFVRVNASFKAKLGFDATELAEKPFLDWIDPCDRSIVEAALENGEMSFFARHITRDGSTLRLEIQVAEHADGLFVLGRRAQASTQFEFHEARSDEATVSGTLDAIARIIEEQNTGYKCSILLVAEGRFVFGAGPSLPDEYNSAVNGYAVGPTVGSCGTAIFWNTPVIVEDIQADPLWAPLAALARKAGVAACWSHPFVSSSGKVLGALALYSPEPRAPTTEQLSRLKVAARITGLAVERGRAEERLKSAEEATKAARNLLQQIIDTAPVRVFWKDRDSRYLGCNPAFARDAGKQSPSEMIGLDDYAMNWKAQADLYRADDRNVMDSGQPHLGYEEPQTTRDNKLIWLRTSKVPLHNPQGEVMGVLGMYEDITGQKREERRLALAMDATKMLTWEVDFTTGKLGYHGSGLANLGLDTADAPATLEGWLARAHPDDRAQFTALLAQALQPDDTHGFDYEYRFQDLSGHHHWLQTVGRVVHRDAAGSPLLAAGYTINIDERKNAEQALKASEAAQRSLIAALPDVIMRFDAEGHHLFVSENVRQVTSLPAAAFIGKTHQELGFPEPMCAFWEHAIRQPFLTGQMYETEFELDGPSGHIVFNWRLIPEVNADGRADTVLAVARDITVSRRSAEFERAKNIAEAASKAKSTFLANMSHELRTPMNGVLGMVDLALHRATDPQQIDWLNKSKSSAQHLLGVINDILDISKIEAGRLTLEHVSFRFGEVLENLLSLLGHKAADKQIKLLIDLDPEVSRMAFLGDPLHLGQILLNLAGNALKFTERGSITVRARRLDDNPDDVLLRIEVADTGIGIAPEDQQRLFTAFEQADGSMTRKYGGTGLGLAITKRLVQLMDGEIGVESNPGQGSTFWFTVRLDKSTDAVLPAPTITGKTAVERLLDEYRGIRILLAEDEPINQVVSRELLKNAGLVVDLAEDGQQALELAKQNTYALILMDMQMPHMNGIEATMAIRALPAYVRTPILAMTANAFDEDRQVCLDAGMNDHIAKPVYRDKLYETLLAWLEKRGN